VASSRLLALNERAIMEALDQGCFYASAGLHLAGYHQDSLRISLKISEDMPGGSCLIEFVGGAGKVLKQVEGNSASYRIRGDEAYVRVRARSPDNRRLWTQPVFPAGD